MLWGLPVAFSITPKLLDVVYKAPQGLASVYLLISHHSFLALSNWIEFLSFPEMLHALPASGIRLVPSCSPYPGTPGDAYINRHVFSSAQHSFPLLEIVPDFPLRNRYCQAMWFGRSEPAPLFQGWSHDPPLTCQCSKSPWPQWVYLGIGCGSSLANEHSTGIFLGTPGKESFSSWSG